MSTSSHFAACCVMATWNATSTNPAPANSARSSSCLRVLRPGGTLSSLGVYSSDLTIPIGPFATGLGDHKIVTTLCPGGKERMRRLMAVVASGRTALRPLVTRRFTLHDRSEERRGGEAG